MIFTQPPLAPVKEDFLSRCLLSLWLGASLLVGISVVVCTATLDRDHGPLATREPLRPPLPHQKTTVPFVPPAVTLPVTPAPQPARIFPDPVVVNAPAILI